MPKLFKNTVRQALMTRLRNGSCRIEVDDPEFRMITRLEPLNLVTTVEPLTRSNWATVHVNPSGVAAFLATYATLPRELTTQTFGDPIAWKLYEIRDLATPAELIAEWLMEEEIPCRKFPGVVFAWYPALPGLYATIESALMGFVVPQFRAKVLKEQIEARVMQEWGAG